MNGTFVRRVAQLEQKQVPEVRRRYVFWDKHNGEPRHEAMLAFQVNRRSRDFGAQILRDRFPVDDRC